MVKKNTYSQWPDEKGYFGQYGGRYVAETLMPLIMDVEKYYNELKDNDSFKNIDPSKAGTVLAPIPYFQALIQ